MTNVVKFPEIPEWPHPFIISDSENEWRNSPFTDVGFWDANGAPFHLVFEFDLTLASGRVVHVYSDCGYGWGFIIDDEKGIIEFSIDAKYPMMLEDYIIMDLNYWNIPRRYEDKDNQFTTYKRT